MVAYNFKRRFVAPICMGLDIPIPRGFEVGSGLEQQEPKFQTIREVGLRRHVRPGEMMQLYYAQRTKQCFKIGEARCKDAIPIFINMAEPLIHVDGRDPINRPRALDLFAQRDGFGDFADMREFWLEEHSDCTRDFRGAIFFWEDPA